MNAIEQYELAKRRERDAWNRMWTTTDYRSSVSRLEWEIAADELRRAFTLTTVQPLTDMAENSWWSSVPKFSGVFWS